SEEALNVAKQNAVSLGLIERSSFCLSNWAENIQEVFEFISKHEKVYCLDQKYTSYFISHPNLIDLNQVMLDQENKLAAHQCNTKVHTDYYIEAPYNADLNKAIPVSKHYEKSECLYEQIEQYIGKEQDQAFYRELVNQYRIVESNGIDIQQTYFNKYYEPTWQPYSIKHNRIYSYYNLYNLTTRPTNAFNAINFLALNKEDHSRKSYIPVNDMFVEFDFDAYHLMLIAKLIGFECPESSMHVYLGKQYFETEELTEEQYSQAKTITFRQIYGGLQKEYKHIPFFQAIEAYIQKLWSTYQETGEIVLQTGRPLHLSKNSLNPQKLFNYMIQNAETYQNVSILKKLNSLLEYTHSKIVLVVYDSFLLDFSLKDGKQLLLDIKDVIESEGFKAKVKVGKDYDSLVKKDYL
ncbi:MAG: hypothetical protein EB127_28165, partial [Alphaproteobacteria bacterium]|nr:hypothetical protein [Alphaproteobacteria bacterium]